MEIKILNHQHGISMMLDKKNKKEISDIKKALKGNKFLRFLETEQKETFIHTMDFDLTLTEIENLVLRNNRKNEKKFDSNEHQKLGEAIDTIRNLYLKTLEQQGS